ncbi:MAG: adenylate cyclase regulatory domain-containing protein [Actinomycetes bacterium]
MDESKSSVTPEALAALEAAGLLDPDAPTAHERVELLTHLLGRFSVDEIITWAARSHVMGVAARSIDQPPPLISAVEASERAGVPLATVLQMRQALGFPVIDVDEPSMPATVVEDLGTFALGVELFGEESTLSFARVLGWSTARMMEAARAMFGGSSEADGGRRRTELEWSQANETAIAAWVQVGGLVQHLLSEQALREVGFVHSLMAGELRSAVAFVDLVGSTSWAEGVDASVHSAALRRFEMQASSIAAEHGGRLVKLIGDEAMVVAAHPGQLCRIALGICDLAESDPDLPPARGAVGFGVVTARDGDYFGPLVNTVARAGKIADPGGVVVTAEVARALDPESWQVTPLGLHELSGVADQVHLSSVRALA